MAKIKYNPVLIDIRGRIQGLIFRLSHSGKPTVYAVPDMSGVKWSKAQKQQRVNFKNANRYARMAMDIPELHAYYLEMAAKRNSKQPYNMAVSDYSKGDDTHNSLLRLFRQQEGEVGCIIITEELQYPPCSRQVSDDFCI